MEIYETLENKKKHLDLLLLADEDERMIDKYLHSGTMLVLDDGGVRCVSVITDEGDGILEIKNIAVSPESQGKGYGRAMIDHIRRTYRGRYEYLQVGTGDSPLTVPFYERCGFVRSHIKKNFFVDNYDHPLVECGVRLVDMVYLKMML